MSNLKQVDKTFAYETGFGFFQPKHTVVMLDVSTVERKTAVSRALENVIDNVYGGTKDGVQPYKDLLVQTKSGRNYIHASDGHLQCLKFALGSCPFDKDLCSETLKSIENAEITNLLGKIEIKDEICHQIDAWTDHGDTYVIGQSVDNPDFFYAKATNGIIEREYEFDHAPSELEVMSKHADKLAEEAIDLGEAEHSADGYAAFPDPRESTVENIPQKQDISHNFSKADISAQEISSQGMTKNAELSAKRAERQENMCTFEVSSMTKLDGGQGAKALATVAINGEFVVSGVKVMEGKNGLFAAMPSYKGNDGNYKDIVFPKTPEAREQLNSAVINTFNDMTAKGLDKIRNDIPAPDKSVSKITADLRKSSGENVKAAGQIVIDDSIVVTGVKLCKGTNAQGETKMFTAMPSYQTKTGEYSDYAHPITADAHNKIEKAVKSAYNNIDRYEYRGVKYAELGDKENISNSGRLNKQFADKLMNELDKAGIKYQAKIAETATISFKSEDKPAFDAVKKDLVKSLNGKTNDAPKQDKTQKHAKTI